jgi:hypothetical protein
MSFLIDGSMVSGESFQLSNTTGLLEWDIEIWIQLETYSESNVEFSLIFVLVAWNVRLSKFPAVKKGYV